MLPLNIRISSHKIMAFNIHYTTFIQTHCAIIAIVKMKMCNGLNVYLQLARSLSVSLSGIFYHIKSMFVHYYYSCRIIIMRFCASLNCKKMRNANVLAPSAWGDQRKSEWKSQQILQFYQNNYFAQRIQLFWQPHSFQLLNDTLTLFLYLSHLLLLYPPTSLRLHLSYLPSTYCR